MLSCTFEIVIVAFGMQCSKGLTRVEESELDRQLSSTLVNWNWFAFCLACNSCFRLIGGPRVDSLR